VGEKTWIQEIKSDKHKRRGGGYHWDQTGKSLTNMKEDKVNNNGPVNEQENIKRVFIEKIKEHLYEYYWEELGLRDWKKRTEDRINEVPRRERVLKTIESFIGGLQGKRILIVGSGWGGDCVAARNLGATEVIGIDIDSDVNEIANLRMLLEGYEKCCFNGAAEHLPFKDNQFDYVHCFTVLEHVNNVKMSLAEMLRVTKKGSYIFIQAPNYLRPIERHYKIPYIPLMPKRLAKIYLRLLKRPTDFIDSINYIWPGKINKLLSGINNIEIEQIVDEYKHRFNSSINYVENRSPSLLKPEMQKKSAKELFLIVVNKLLTTFHKTWDFIFHTKEIYFLIRKCQFPR
jgi:ubiquinone/menaquinone biosynthesis C-methylase UbiE